LIEFGDSGLSEELNRGWSEKSSSEGADRERSPPEMFGQEK
jgi:hypothetical protein